MAPPRRAIKAQPNRRELLIFSLGDNGAEEYLNYWHRLFRGTVNIEFHAIQATPTAVVASAITAKRAAEKRERRGQGRAHDEVWCVLDAAYENLGQTSELATAHEINLAISNPCLELWFLLHFAEQTRPINAGETRVLARRHLAYDHGLDAAALAALAANHDAAVERARALEARPGHDDAAPPGNPSSGMWRLVGAIDGRTSREPSS